MKLSRLAVDTDKSENGIWREIGHGSGFEVRIARANNSKFRAAVEREVLNIVRNSSGMPGAEEQSDATLRAFCAHIVLDWRGLEDDEGNAIPYSPETAYKILSDPAYVDVRSGIEAVANNEKAYRREVAVGN